MRLEVRDDGWQVTPPGFRFDIALEVDLIEELGRIHGYPALPVRRPRGWLQMKPRTETQLGKRRMRALLVDLGYQEVVTYSFVDDALQRRIEPDVPAITLANPIASDMGAMRTSLWPGLLAAAKYNLNRQQTRLQFFETGLKYLRQHAEIKEEEYLAGVVTGLALPEQWSVERRDYDFFDAKADVEALLALGGEAAAYEFVADNHPALHPGQCAKIMCNGTEIGWLGALHPHLERDLDVPQRVYLFELAIEAISAKSLPAFREISKYPSIRRDLAIVVDQHVTAQEIRRCVEAEVEEILANLQLFDVYSGKGVDSGRKSVALGLTLQASSRTLIEADVDALIERLINKLNKNLGATLRE
jgi:phenylalanyl-tRNA synthetase beta chain